MKLPVTFPPWRSLSSTAVAQTGTIANSHLIFETSEDASRAQNLWPTSYGELKPCEYQTTLNDDYFSHGKLSLSERNHRLHLVVEGRQAQPTRFLWLQDSRLMLLLCCLQDT